MRDPITEIVLHLAHLWWCYQFMFMCEIQFFKKGFGLKKMCVKLKILVRPELHFQSDHVFMFVEFLFLHSKEMWYRRSPHGGRMQTHIQKYNLIQESKQGCWSFVFVISKNTSDNWRWYVWPKEINVVRIWVCLFFTNAGNWQETQLYFLYIFCDIWRLGVLGCHLCLTQLTPHTASSNYKLRKDCNCRRVLSFMANCSSVQVNTPSHVHITFFFFWGCAWPMCQRNARYTWYIHICVINSKYLPGLIACPNDC